MKKGEEEARKEERSFCHGRAGMLRAGRGRIPLPPFLVACLLSVRGLACIWNLFTCTCRQAFTCSCLRLAGYHTCCVGGDVVRRPGQQSSRVRTKGWGGRGYQPLTNEDLKNLREGVARQLLNFGDHRVLSQHPEMRPGGSWRKILEEFDVEDDVRNQFNPRTSDLMWRHLQEQR